MLPAKLGKFLELKSHYVKSEKGCKMQETPLKNLKFYTVVSLQKFRKWIVQNSEINSIWQLIKTDIPKKLKSQE